MEDWNKRVQELKAWYERERGTKGADEKAGDAAFNLLQFGKILLRWQANRQRDLNGKPDDKKPVSK